MAVRIGAAANTIIWQVHTDVHIGNGRVGNGVGDGASDRTADNETEVDISLFPVIIGEHQRGGVFPFRHAFPILRGVVLRPATEIGTQGGIHPDCAVERQAGDGVVAVCIRTRVIPLSGITSGDMHVGNEFLGHSIHHSPGDGAA